MLQKGRTITGSQGKSKLSRAEVQKFPEGTANFLCQPSGSGSFETCDGRNVQRLSMK